MKNATLKFAMVVSVFLLAAPAAAVADDGPTMPTTFQTDAFAFPDQPNLKDTDEYGALADLSAQFTKDAKPVKGTCGKKSCLKIRKYSDDAAQNAQDDLSTAEDDITELIDQRDQERQEAVGNWADDQSTNLHELVDGVAASMLDYNDTWLNGGQWIDVDGNAHAIQVPGGNPGDGMLDVLDANIEAAKNSNQSNFTAFVAALCTKKYSKKAAAAQKALDKANKEVKKANSKKEKAAAAKDLAAAKKAVAAVATSIKKCNSVDYATNQQDFLDNLDEYQSDAQDDLSAARDDMDDNVQTVQDHATTQVDRLVAQGQSSYTKQSASITKKDTKTFKALDRVATRTLNKLIP